MMLSVPTIKSIVAAKTTRPVPRITYLLALVRPLVRDRPCETQGAPVSTACHRTDGMTREWGRGRSDSGRVRRLSRPARGVGSPSRHSRRPVPPGSATRRHRQRVELLRRRKLACGRGRGRLISARRLAQTVLDFAEVQLALGDGGDRGEDCGAQEAEDGIAESKADPGGDEGEAEQGCELLEVEAEFHWSSLR